MTISGIDQLVLDAESEIQAIQAHADQIVIDLKKSMPDHLKEMAIKIVDSTIEENPKAVTDLGNKAKELKNQIANLIETFPNEVITKLDNIAWVHKRSIVIEQEEYLIVTALEKETKMALNNLGSLILGKLGSLLINNQLASLSDRSYWKNENNNKVAFRYGLGFYSTIKKTKFDQDEESYVAVIDKYIKALKKLEKARNNRNKLEARKFWDEA